MVIGKPEYRKAEAESSPSSENGVEESVRTAPETPATAEGKFVDTYEAEAMTNVHARRAVVRVAVVSIYRMGACAAGDCCVARQVCAAGSAAADLRACIVFLLVTLALSAGILTNLTFKSYWGRPRPVVVTQFNGDRTFVPWWDPRGGCGRNCSFFSGEGATAFWTYAPAALAPPAWRPLAYAAATLFGIITSLLRMAFGGHFFTDVAMAGLVTFLVIWLAYG